MSFCSTTESIVTTSYVLILQPTTFDGHKILSTCTHGNVMVLSDEDDQENGHPYWYAWIISIFHAMVLHKGSKSESREVKKMDFLFVRWFGLDDSPKARGGWKAKKLHQIGFIEGNAAFGFIDPADVVRVVHLTSIP